MKISPISNLSYFNELSKNVNRKTNFSNFNKELFEKDDKNEVLYIVLHKKNNILSKIYEYIEEYGKV